MKSGQNLSSTYLSSFYRKKSAHEIGSSSSKQINLNDLSTSRSTKEKKG